MKFKVNCPECNAVIITELPQAIIWEHCPSCKNHIWDQYDILMAEAFVHEHPGVHQLRSPA